MDEAIDQSGRNLCWSLSPLRTVYLITSNHFQSPYRHRRGGRQVPSCVSQAKPRSAICATYHGPSSRHECYRCYRPKTARQQWPASQSTAEGTGVRRAGARSMKNEDSRLHAKSTSNVLHRPSGTRNKKPGSQSGEANPQACVRITVLPRDARARRRRDEEVSERYQRGSPGRG